MRSHKGSGPSLHEAFERLAKDFNVNISPYNPHANGVVETTHFIIREALMRLCRGDPSSWPRYLRAALNIRRLDCNAKGNRLQPIFLLHVPGARSQIRHDRRRTSDCAHQATCPTRPANLGQVQVPVQGGVREEICEEISQGELPAGRFGSDKRRRSRERSIVRQKNPESIYGPLRGNSRRILPAERTERSSPM